MTPQFDGIEVSVSFEVFCSCGAGLCNQSDTRSSRRRGEPQVVVEPCPDCLAKERDPRDEKIEELQQLLDEAREMLSETQDRLAESRDHS